MFEARQGKEIVVEVRNNIDVLLDISKMLSEKGLSILAVCGVVDVERCTVRLVTDDNLRAVDMLRERGYHPREEEAVIASLPHRPGILKRVAETLSFEDIQIRHLYATGFESTERVLVVLQTTNDDAAIPRLNGIPWYEHEPAAV